MDLETITVTYGAQTFSPVRYNSFTVGPFSYTTIQKPDETLVQAYQRAWEYLQKIASHNYTLVRAEYYSRLEQQQ